MMASTLCLDAVHMIKTVLAGTAMKNFTDVIEAVFGGIKDKSVHTAMEAEEGLLPEEEEEVDQPSTSTLSKVMIIQHKNLIFLSHLCIISILIKMHGFTYFIQASIIIIITQGFVYRSCISSIKYSSLFNFKLLVFLT